jgi:protein required for attachment to host cells
MRIAHDTIVMVADGEKSLIFRNEGDERYPVLETLSRNEQSHPPSREQGRDKPGRTAASVGARRSSYSQTDRHQHAEDRFAAQAAWALEEAAAVAAGGIIVLAPPRTLGVLRQHWGRRTREKLLAEIDKNLTHHTTDHVITAIAAEPVTTSSGGGQ